MKNQTEMQIKLAEVQTELLEAHRKLGEAFHQLARANRMLDELRFALLIGGVGNENRNEETGTGD